MIPFKRSQGSSLTKRRRVQQATRKLIEPLDLLIVDDNQYTRKLTRMMLMNIGVKSIFEAADGVTALDIIRNVNPAVMLMD